MFLLTRLALLSFSVDLLLFSQALAELQLLFSYLKAMKCLEHISFDLSLARGLHYYTGLIYEVVMPGKTWRHTPARAFSHISLPWLTTDVSDVGSIAAGGRYDNLVNMFSSSSRQVPCVGVSIGIERVFVLMERKAKRVSVIFLLYLSILSLCFGFLLSQALKYLWQPHLQLPLCLGNSISLSPLSILDTSLTLTALQTGGFAITPADVFVASVGKELVQARMSLCEKMWSAGFSAEMSYSESPTLTKQLNHVLERGIPVMVRKRGSHALAHLGLTALEPRSSSASPS